MLEKLAEMVRKQSNSRPHYQGGVIPCFACDMRPVMSTACDKYNFCPDTGKLDGSLMIARWAVLLVAKGLPSWEEYKQAGIEYRRSVKEWEEAKDKAMPMDDVIYAKLCAFAKWTELHGMVMDELTDLIAEAKEDTNDAV